MKALLRDFLCMYMRLFYLHNSWKMIIFYYFIFFAVSVQLIDALCTMSIIYTFRFPWMWMHDVNEYHLFAYLMTILVTNWTLLSMYAHECVCIIYTVCVTIFVRFILHFGTFRNICFVIFVKIDLRHYKDFNCRLFCNVKDLWFPDGTHECKKCR